MLAGMMYPLNVLELFLMALSAREQPTHCRRVTDFAEPLLSRGRNVVLKTPLTGRQLSGFE